MLTTCEWTCEVPSVSLGVAGDRGLQSIGEILPRLLARYISGDGLAEQEEGYCAVSDRFSEVRTVTCGE